MKNPLTGTQRKHVQILKNKMQEVIEEYLQSESSQEEKEEFTWAVNHRSSKLIDCKTDRFYLFPGPNLQK